MQEADEGLILDDWQKEALEYDGNLLLCTGRQNGKTFIMSRKIAKYMLTNPNSRIIVASLTEDQAKLIIMMTLDYLEKFHKKELAKGKHKPTQNKIYLTNKSQVIARPVGTTGDAIRGFTGDVLVLDEVSRFSELIMEAATPILFSTGGKIWLCSTPFGKKGYFWERYNEAVNLKNPKARFKVIHTNSEEVAYNRQISKSWTERQRAESIAFLEKEKAEKSKLQYGQEYLGLFMEDLQQYFSDEWIDNVCTLKQNDVLCPPGKDYFLGVDIARYGGDESSFEIIRRVNKKNLIHVYTETKTRVSTTWTENRIKELDKAFHFRRIYIDAGAGSLGVGVLDHLIETPGLKNKVVAINNRKIIYDKMGHQQRLLKEDLYDNLRSLGEQSQIKLLDNEEVRISLKSVQFEFDMKFGQPTRIRIFGNYTHIAEGLIRAAWCSKEKIINTDISYI